MASYSPRQQVPAGAQQTSPSSQRFPSVAESNDPSSESPKRRPSFNFLRRAKSIERLVPGSRKSSAAGGPDEPSRKVSNGKLSKRQRSIKRRQAMEKEQIPPHPPQIPQMPKPPQIQNFGGDEARPDSVAIVSGHTYTDQQYSVPTSPLSQINGYPNVPVPPIPAELRFRNPSLVDPYARSESMTHRGRYSYASSMVSTVNGPRKVRRRKDPTPFNVLIIGARNCGKTSFLNFLKDSLAQQQKRKPSVASQFRLVDESQIPPSGPSPTFPSYTSHYLECDMDGERIGITLWDSKGLEAHILDLQLREMSSFIESKFEETFSEENKVLRSPGVRDTHIHCVLFLLDPLKLDANLATAKKKGARKGMVANNGNSFFDNKNPSAMGIATAATYGGLDENLDLQVLRTLQGKTTVVPVISKADTITGAHMKVLKRSVFDSIKQADLDALSALGLNDGDDLDEEDEDGEGASEDSDVLPSTLKDHDHHLSPNSSRPAGHQSSLSNTSHLSSPSNSDDQASSPSSFKTDNFDVPNPPGSGLPPSSSSQPTTHTPSEQPAPFIPLSIISPDPYEPEIIGRKFPWGFADPMDKTHCDFVKLKDSVFENWRSELKEVSTGLEGWYEAWRSERLAHGGGARVANGRETATGRKGALGNGPVGGNVVGSDGVGHHQHQQHQQHQQQYGRAW